MEIRLFALLVFKDLHGFLRFERCSVESGSLFRVSLGFAWVFELWPTCPQRADLLVVLALALRPTSWFPGLT